MSLEGRIKQLFSSSSQIYLWNTMFYTILIIFICQTSGQFMPKDQSPLYRADDENVVHLDANNFDQIVNNPNRNYTLMVQLNMAWCGKCREIANKYSYFAGNVSSWNRLFKVGAIICGEGPNKNYCDNYTQSFPSTTIFDPLINQENEVEQNGARNITILMMDQFNKVPNLIRKSVDHLTSLSESGRAPSSWPDLRMIRANSVEELFSVINSQNIPKNSTIVMVLDEQLEEDPQMAKKVLLDLSAGPKELVARRLINSRELLRELNHTSGDSRPILIVIPESREKEHIRIIRWDEIGSHYPESSQHRRLVHYLFQEFAQKYVKLQPVYMGDMYKALHHSFFDEIMAHRILNFSHIQALSKYATAIYRNFPFDNENPRRFFLRLDHWLRVRKPGSQIESKDLLAFMRAGNEGFIPQIEHYIHCRSGYSCALWHLFHTLTVSEFNLLTGNETKKSLNPKKHQQVHKQVGPQVLFAFRDYVRYFYNCSECSQNFLTTTATLRSELEHLNSSILWLWQTHNRISKRISDLNPSNAKAQFPARSVCPKCFTPSNHWNNSEILSFLINYYRRDNLMKVRSGQMLERPGISTLTLTITSIIFFWMLN
ncbi:sulfhydryl oxidase 2-like [Brevipalpus obovatus]|uniref:sulfhydryl oxidase 2-like n=1 Tax=Brevipalpus obovatus TaxID=246614 RepID=UPI003D9F33B6